MIEKPIIGITFGDFNGIGPELIVRTLTDATITKICVPVVFGSSKMVSKYRRLLQMDDQPHFQIIKSFDQINKTKTNIINCWEEDLAIEPGKTTEAAGKCAYEALKQGCDALEAGSIQALVTAPINKQNIKSEEFPFIGHTEFLAQRFQSQHKTLMLMVSPLLRVGLVTDHVSVQQITEQIKAQQIEEKLDALLLTLRQDFAILKPKIAILGLNPHAGDGGEIGQEEKNILQPIIDKYLNKGDLVFGPFPADGFFAAGKYSKYDAVLAMYHDQGLIPFKMLAFQDGVNFTAGIPFVRTSPDHGTAYDLAGKGTADTGSFLHAIYTACDILENRKRAAEWKQQKPSPVALKFER